VRKAPCLLPACLCALGCAEPALRLRPAAPPTARAYGSVYERWTRVGRVHSWKELDTMLVLHATLRSEEYQQAYLARRAELYRMASEAERRRLQDEEAERDRAGVRFLVQSMGHNYTWADLVPGRGFWQLRLIPDDDDGAAVAPIAIEQVKSTQALETEIYRTDTPSVPTPFVRTFHVTFPKASAAGKEILGSQTRKLTLRVAGPQGKTDLTWKFIP
jgi:hypothetical protein